MIEVLKQMVEALEWCHGGEPIGTAEAIKVGKQAIAELESQERNFCPRCGKRTNDIHTCTPPQRTWVGLTDEEKDHLIGLHIRVAQGAVDARIEGLDDFIQAIEAKLKEKNSA